MRRDKGRERRIARERIDILMDLAHREAKRGFHARVERYVALAKRIGMRYNIRFPHSLKRRLCKNCNAYLLPPTNCRVRLTGGTISIFCFRCNKYTRIPYIREKKKARQAQIKEVRNKGVRTQDLNTSIK